MDQGAGDLQRAERDLKAIRTRFPRNATAPYLLGTLYLNLNRNAEAIEPLITAAHLNARNMDAQLMAGLACFRAGHYEQAISYTDRAIKIAPTASAPYLLQARIFANHGTVEQGVTALRNYLARAKNPAPGYYMLGRLYYRRRRRTEAENAIRRALQADPNNADYWAILGHIYCELEGGVNSQQGIDAYNKALELRPGDGETHAALGRALMNLRQWDEAVLHLRTALANSPDPAPVLYSLGTALMRSGHQDEGRRILAEYATAQKYRSQARSQ